MNGTALVTVNDMDDNDPVFNKSSYSMSFPENTSGAIDMMITATDRDRVSEWTKETEERTGRQWWLSGKRN